MTCPCASCSRSSRRTCAPSPASSTGHAEPSGAAGGRCTSPPLRDLRGDGARGTRTPDLLGAIQALSQLSYSPEEGDSLARCRTTLDGGPGEMSFRNRLTLFFVAIVIVPMLSVAFVLFSLIADNENGKADARLAAPAGAPDRGADRAGDVSPGARSRRERDPPRVRGDGLAELRRRRVRGGL